MTDKSQLKEKPRTSEKKSPGTLTSQLCWHCKEVTNDV